MVNLWLSTKNRQRISFYLSKGPGMKCAINVAFDSSNQTWGAVSIHLYTVQNHADGETTYPASSVTRTNWDTK
jgi:hypothetical protein